MGTELEQQVKEFLARFFQAMNAWEKRRHELDQFVCRRKPLMTAETAKTEYHKQLVAIFDEFCEYKNAPLKASRGGYHYQTPPGYNLEKEQILEIQEKGGKILVTTLQTFGHPRKFLYTLKKTKDGFRVMDNRKEFLEFENKWAPWDL